MAFTAVDNLWSFHMEFRSPKQGWSERHFLSDAGTPDLKTRCTTLLNYRLALLPQDCVCVYARYSNVGGKRDSIPLKFAYPAPGEYLGEPIPPGTPAAGTLHIEVSQIAVHVRIWNAQGEAASRYVHGVPDARVTGEALTTEINEATAAPPPLGDAAFSTDWAVRFGYYMWMVRTTTVLGRKLVGLGALVSQFQQDVIADLMVRGITLHETGAPFDQRPGRQRVG